jgi:hypothetical protein
MVRKISFGEDEFIEGELSLGEELEVTGHGEVGVHLVVSCKDDLQVTQIKDMAGNPMSMSLRVGSKGVEQVCHINSQGLFHAQGVDRFGMRQEATISITDEGIKLV